MSIRNWRSPFTPGRFPKSNLFVGREEEIRRFRQKNTSDLKSSIPAGFVVKGERSIGKASFVNYVINPANYLDSNVNLYYLFVDLGHIRGVGDSRTPTLELFFGYVIYQLMEKIRINNTLWKRCKKLFEGLNNTLETFGFFSPNISWDSKEDKTGPLRITFESLIQKFCQELINAKEKDGFVLALENINGLAKNPAFAPMLKGLMESFSRNHVPFSLVISTHPRTWELIRQSEESTPRIFHPINLGPLIDNYVKTFFIKAFKEYEIQICSDALNLMVHCANGQPYFMHEIGDAVFWTFMNNSEAEAPCVSEEIAKKGIAISLDRVGQTRFNSEVFETIQSKKYYDILKSKDFTSGDDLVIRKREIRKITEGLGFKESILTNFIDKMINIGVLKYKRKGSGEYEFASVLLKMYLRAYSTLEQ